MELRKVATLPPQERTSKYDDVVAEVRAAKRGQLFVLETDHVKNVGQLAQYFKDQFDIKATVRNGELFLEA